MLCFHMELKINKLGFTALFYVSSFFLYRFNLSISYALSTVLSVFVSKVVVFCLYKISRDQISAVSCFQNTGVNVKIYTRL